MVTSGVVSSTGVSPSGFTGGKKNRKRRCYSGSQWPDSLHKPFLRLFCRKHKETHCDV